jgi:hypothetical protein
MYTIAQQWRRQSLVVAAAAALMIGCAHDSSVGPATELQAAMSSSTQKVGADLGSCDTLRVPAGSQLALHVYAKGWQIYQWNGTSWGTSTPLADLFANADFPGVVGSHYAGPKWESLSGSTIRGAVSERCTPNPDAIPWLRLDVVSIEGRGVFQGVTHIQRVNTLGGKAPTEGGSSGEVRRVPYTAEYFFYRAP